MNISVVIPTYRRPDYLAKALSGLINQNRKPDEVVIGTREGDEFTAQFLAEFHTELFPLKIVVVTVPGVIASMNAGIQESSGDLVCLLDDDAEPLPDWVEKVETAFYQDPKLGALGGRDLLQDHPEMRREEPTTDQVGILTPYGRIIGNHHRGEGAFRHVDLLKGCNIAINGNLLREIGIETQLLGQGAQVHWELALCLDLKRKGFVVAYDPSLKIIHHIAPRLDDDQIHRGKFSRQGLYDLVYNEHFVIHSRLNGQRALFHFLWSLAVGSLAAPGLVQYLRGKLRKEKLMEQKLLVTLRATLKGKSNGKRSSRAKRLKQNA
jgi:GT2 family glycosyltransferase